MDPGPSVFISYAHEDHRYLKDLLETIDQYHGRVRAWSDKEIESGEQWHQEIQGALASAKVAVLLVSRSFLVSKYICNSELPVLLKNAADRGLVILPVILRPCAFSTARFKYPDPITGPNELLLSDLQAANSPSKPLNSLNQYEKDLVFQQIGDRIHRILNPQFSNKSAAGLVDAAPNERPRVNPKDGQTYVWIPPGEFMMGCSPGDDECFADEKPAHKVTITRGFWISQQPVTQEAYQRVIGKSPSRFTGPRLPVEMVTWNQAQEYCAAIGMRLPTEAEWEYAARGGIGGKARHDSLDSAAWYEGNSGNMTHEVGQKRPNGFGLYDMLGNVWEWVNDMYDKNYYGQQSASNPDPSGPIDRQYRTLRGGSWVSVSRYVRASARHHAERWRRDSSIGFRCAGGLP